MRPQWLLGSGEPRAGRMHESGRREARSSPVPAVGAWVSRGAWQRRAPSVLLEGRTKQASWRQWWCCLALAPDSLSAWCGEVRGPRAALRDDMCSLSLVDQVWGWGTLGRCWAICATGLASGPAGIAQRPESPSAAGSRGDSPGAAPVGPTPLPSASCTDGLSVPEFASDGCLGS